MEGSLRILRKPQEFCELRNCPLCTAAGASLTTLSKRMQPLQKNARVSTYTMIYGAITLPPLLAWTCVMALPLVQECSLLNSADISLPERGIMSHSSGKRRAARTRKQSKAPLLLQYYNVQKRQEPGEEKKSSITAANIGQPVGMNEHYHLHFHTRTRATTKRRTPAHLYAVHGTQKHDTKRSFHFISSNHTQDFQTVVICSRRRHSVSRHLPRFVKRSTALISQLLASPFTSLHQTAQCRLVQNKKITSMKRFQLFLLLLFTGLVYCEVSFVLRITLMWIDVDKQQKSSKGFAPTSTCLYLLKN